MPFPFVNGDVLTATDMNALNRLPPTVKSTSFTLALTDEAKWLSCQGASSMTVTIPPNSSVALPIGSQILIGRNMASSLTIARGSGVTLYGILGQQNYTVANQDGFVTLLKYSADQWYIMGDVA